MKSNVVLAAIAGLVLGVIAELFFSLVDQIPVIGCLVTPVALLFGLGLPLLIGAFAVIFAPSRELTAPMDGALAAALAELVSRLVGFCASLYFARSFFFGPRFLLPGIEPATRALFSGIWSLGWLVVSLAVAAILGAIGASAYALRNRR
ncbi:MAG: hypothetical protein HZB51_29645 [Chloroflexi bacterium]|nr:hypothetical protein [Chloroflexota bacterium]